MASWLMKVWIFILICFTTCGRFLFKSFLTMLYCGRKRIVPPVNDPVLVKSAISLASDIREGRIKSEDAIKSYCARIKEVNLYVNAVADERFEEALEEARKVDELVSYTKSPQQLESEKPLLGVPFTAKILLGVKGMPCNAASLLHKGVLAYEDAEVVALMKNAGAICLATTNSPEFGLNFETYNSIYGRTSNPYDTTKTAGGSSGGEGALLGAGASLIGLGNDFAGSIRHPSNFNGIFGHKPSSGLVSNAGMFPVVTPKLNKTISTGPMCRYAEDLVLSMKILSGVNNIQLNLDKPVDFSKLKLYYILDVENPLAPKVSQDIKDKIMNAVCHFESTYGTPVKHIKLKELRMACLIYVHVQMSSVETKIPDILTGGKCKLNPSIELLKAAFGHSKLTLGPLFTMNTDKFPMVYRKKNCPEMLIRFKEIEKLFESILDDNSVLFLPSFTSAAHYHHELISLLPSLSFLCLFNVLGFPVTQCPAGLSRSRLPLGFQIAAGKGYDRLSLACALEVEKIFGGWMPPNS